MVSARVSNLGALVASATLLAARLCHADTPVNATRAQILFEEARELIRDGRFAEACPRLVESQRLEPAGGTLVNLALCWEKAGHVGRAVQTYAAAEKQANADGREDRRKFAEEHLQALRDRVPKVLVMGEIAPKAAIRIDGDLVPLGELGAPLPLDPGQHVITVTAPGHQSWSQKFVVFERETTRVDLPALHAAEPAPSVDPIASEGYEKRRYYKKQVTEGAIALFIVGGASMTASTVTGTVALIQSLTPPRSTYDYSTGVTRTTTTTTNDAGPMWAATGGLLVGGGLMVLVGALIPHRQVEITPGVGGANVSVRW